MGQHHGEEGVSEVIAAVLLIGITVLAVTIISVILLSGPHPDEIPHTAIVVRNEGGKFALVHEGGDPLRVGEYRIYIDTGGGLENGTGDFTEPEGGVWLIGGVLNHTGGANLIRVVVTVLTGGGGETILSEVDFGKGFSGGVFWEEGKAFPPDPVVPGTGVAHGLFTAYPTEGNAPLTVQFTDLSINSTAWLWDFGDGNTSTVQNHTHTYTSAGTYSVTLNASNAHGYSISAPVTITVLAPPAANFIATPLNGTAPLAVQFNDTSTGNVTKWLWGFGDGTTSTEQHPAHTYEGLGTYTVTLNASNAYGSDSKEMKYIFVNDDGSSGGDKPVANFTANVTIGNAPLAVQFNDTSTGGPTNWSWNFGDGTNSIEQHPVHTYESPGIYNVSLTASNAYGYNISAPVTISVLELPAAAFNATPTEGNAPLAVQFTDESTGNVTAWAWDFGDGTWFNTTNPVERNATHTYTNVGTYNVTLNASNAYGYNISAPVTITVLEPPAAAFNANVTEGNAPLAVQFTDTSSQTPTSWFWDFGDETNSTEQHPVHTYESPGIYNVSLTASNAYGFSIETKTDYIIVLAPPVANFTANVTVIPVGAAVQFNDTSTGNITTRSWAFGDDTNTSTEQNPVHIYTSPGTYTVNLTVSNAYGEDTESKVAYIDVGYPPAANFTANVTEGNAPLTVQFNDTSTGEPTNWSWNFGDGTNSIEQHPIHTYTAVSNYTVTLNASNAYGYDVSAPTQIIVLEPLVAGFNATPTEGNAPLVVQFTDESTGNVTTWLWNFGDGNTSDVQNPAYTYTEPGNYTVNLTATWPGGSGTKTKPEYITVLEPPKAAFTANVTVIPVGAAVQFTDNSTGNITTRFWAFGDDTNTSTEQNPVHIYTSPGTYTVNLTVSNAYGEDTESKVAYIDVVGYPPAANFTANVTEGNAPLTVQFTDESTGDITDWFWNFGDGNTSDVQNPTYTYTEPGNYTVTLNASNDYGYDISIPITITVLEPPAAVFNATPTEGNAPLTVQFTDQSTGNVTSWSWDFGDGNTSDVQNPTYTYTAVGNYTVSLTASNAYGEDTETRTAYITVLEPPAAAFSATPTEGNAPLAVQFTDESTGNATSWSWDFGDGTNSTVQHPEHTYAVPGTYTVTLTASNAYGEDTETKTNYITVLEFPTAAFTANVTSGNAPLAVQFTDESTGNVTAWLWNFGDGTTSTEQNPIYTYTAVGNYTVSLAVTRAGASDTETKTDYITVTSPSTTWYDTLLNTAEGKPGYLTPGGYVEFRVTGANSYVKIGGTRYDLATGNTVRLVIGTDGQGQINMGGSMITMFDYDDVTLYINGNQKKRGKIDEIYSSNYEAIVSTLTLSVPPVDKWTQFIVDGETIINTNDGRKITLYNLMPRTNGMMNLNNHPEGIYFVGSITDYTFG